MFYVYGLREKSSDEYRYVGSTNDLQKRMWGHEHSAENLDDSGNAELYRWFAGCAGRVIMEVLETVESKDQQRPTEERWIHRLRGEGFRLFNIRSAAVVILGMNDMGETQKRDIITDYLDRFEADTDKPWLKEEAAVYEV